MCGIAGFVKRQGGAQRVVVQRMCDQIVYRGPDDEGYYVDQYAAIGMRRLSIIDLSQGHQPIANEDESLWVVFNGEIYDYQELRRELANRGHRFKTHSDTETLLHLYEEEGVEGISRLRGMFAYALWDKRERQLVLVRDRFGKKPLYYAVLPDGIVFGSELKCLRAAGIPEDIDEDAIRLYFQLGYIPDPYSAYRSVKKLPPGSWLIYKSDGSVQQGQYWKLPAPAERPPVGVSREEAATRLRELFDEAVRVRMIADVPLGAFLSGGIDSSSIVASMALQSSEPIKTFSIGFEEAQFNELPYAAMVAKQYRTEHHEILVKSNAVDLVQKLVRHFDEPFGDSSAIPTFILSEFTARSVKVALSGDGGDELFGGYESFFTVEKRRWFERVPVPIRGVVGWVSDLLPYRSYGKNYLRELSRPNALERYFAHGTTPYYLCQQLLTRDWVPPGEAGYALRTFAPYLLPNGADVLTQAMYFEATAKLTGDMLVKVDRMSMANSLEVRCPLLDHVLAEYAATLPHQWKIENGSGKRILREALGDRLPPELLARKKMGFGVPLPIWFRGPLRGFVRDHLLSRDFLDRGMVSEPFLRHLIEEHESSRRDNSHQLWWLLMLELWFREQTVACRGSTAA